MRTNYLLILFFLPLVAFSQDGLEAILVEKYYVSDETDNANKVFSGELTPGSVTYRIYVDMKPGYRFQAAFGSPSHPLTITSTQPFFNHSDAGTTHPNILPERALKKDVALLDSWLSVGAAGENHLGVLKENDFDVDSLLQLNKLFFTNQNSKKDFSLHLHDGLRRSSVLPFPTFYQMDSCLSILGNTTKGSKIYTNNGAWACMGKGANGPDSLSTNQVLIAQLTTAGDLSFELNIMIGGPDGKSYKYVSSNPEQDELYHKDLIYDSKKRSQIKVHN